jgi:aryl-alcohol dehydrogenase-like predicted oxidoreductase
MRMTYQKLEYVGKPVSRIVFGTAIKSMRSGEVPSELLDGVLAAGINTFDTAESYDDAEVSLGEWVRSREIRDKVVILTKGAQKNRWRNRVTPYDIESDFETSLVKLDLDYVDIYLLHRDDPSVPVGPIMETLNRFHRDGRAGAIGCSNWHWRRIEEANAYARNHGLVPFSITSPNFGLAVKHDDPEGRGTTLTGEPNRAAREWLLQKKMPVFAYSSLGRGFFSGRISSGHSERAKEALPPLTAKEYAYPDNFERLRRCETLAAQKGVSPAQIAFAWIFTQALNVFPVTSPSSIGHLHETVEAMHIGLTEHEAAWLNLECAVL